MDHAETLSPFTPEEKNWAILAHVTNVAGVVMSAGLLSWLGPLMVMLVKGPESALVAQHSRETLNWCITLLCVKIIYVIFGFVTCTLGFYVGAPVLLAAWVISIYGGIKGGVMADKGEYYTYPFSHPFLKA